VNRQEGIQGRAAFYKSTKSFQGKRSKIVLHDSGLPSGRVIMNSVKAANHSLQIQKQQITQGKKCLSISDCPHLSARSERLCVQIATVPPAGYYSGLAFCTSTDIQQEAIPAGLPFPSAAAGSPS